MSKIEVNAIEPQSGTTLTLGASGDTISLAAGATANIYNGTVNWSSTIRTSGFTAVSGNGYFCDTTSAAFTVTLPASPAFGDIVAIKDWSSTSATNKITIARNGQLIEGNTTDAQIANHGIATTLVYSGASRGWMVTDSGDTQDLQQPQFVAATGGTILTCGNYKTHVFTGPGSFVVSCGGNDAGSNSVEYLVIAGGGGGGRATSSGGGGGAGGFRQNYPSPTIAGLPVTATTYPITIGSGGAGQVYPGGTAPGTQGSSSIFSTITSTGGGYGAGGSESPAPVRNGGPGGSGGGAVYGTGTPAPVSSVGSGNTPPVSPSQGNPGGSGGPQGGAHGGGGGGGAGATGSNGSNPAGGAGGIGSSWTNPLFGPTAPSYGTSGPVPGVRYFAGGGGGGSQCISAPGGAGGSGGGGAGGPGTPGAVSQGTAGTTNTGGGGGGSGNDRGGGTGGSGIVLIRYKYQ
jgi:hypothetical protein